MNNKNVICVTILILILSILVFMFSYYAIHKNKENHMIKNENTETIFESSNINANDDLNETRFINIDSFDKLQSYIKRDTTSILVLGKSGCNFCDLYRPILEEISSDYGLEILYVDFKKLDENEYEKIINSEIRIPKKCTNYDEDISLNKGFGTPMTLFIKGEKSFECIRGYKTKDTLLIELKKLNLIN